MVVAIAPSQPFRFAGFQLPAWGFAIRVWAAMMIALYAAFWLQLEGAATAGVCVGVLAIPTRGQALEKAFWRLFGTLVGVVVSIVIAAAFNGSRELMILSFAAWLAICVYIGGHLDGNRSYGAMLSGYTVAIVAIAQIDAPHTIFAAGVNRGAALAIGVIAVTLVNDLLAAPLLASRVEAKLIDAKENVRSFAVEAFRQGAPSASEVGDLLQAVTAIRTDIDAVAAEGISGTRRAAAAAAALSAMVQEVNIIRALAATLDRLPSVSASERDRLVSALEDSSGRRTAALRDEAISVVRAPTTSSNSLAAASGILLLLQRDRDAQAAIAALQSGRGRQRGPQLPIFRSRRSAGQDALRVFCGIALIGAALSLLNWPAVSAILVTASALIALSGSTPNPRGFVKAACILTPVIAVFAGITKFVLLDGVDAFPLLAIAMAPAIIGGALCLTMPNPATFMLGFLTVVLVPTLLNPANPEDYGALTFLVTALLTTGGMFVLLVALALLFPTTDMQRRRWFLKSAEGDCADAVAGRRVAGGVLSQSFRNASRIAQLAKLKSIESDLREADVASACKYADLSFGVARIRDLLEDLSARVDETLLQQARRALARLDPVALRKTADQLLHPCLEDNGGDREIGLRCGVAMIWMSDIVERAPAEVDRVRGARQ